MAGIIAKRGSVSVRAHVGDAKTPLGFDLVDPSAAKNLAQFTIESQPKGQTPYYIQNELRFETSAQHVQDATGRKLRPERFAETAREGLKEIFGH
jgi:hypothetical protein